MWNVSWRHIESLKVECLTCLIVVHATEEAHWTDPLEVWSFCTFFPLTSSNEPVCQHFRVSTSDQLRSFFFRSAVWTLQLESIPKGIPKAHLSTRSWISFALVPAKSLRWDEWVLSTLPHHLYPYLYPYSYRYLYPFIMSSSSQDTILPTPAPADEEEEEEEEAIQRTPLGSSGSLQFEESDHVQFWSELTFWLQNQNLTSWQPND